MAESIIVSFAENENRYNSVLVVGKKKEKKPIEIINAFSGDEAIELWNKLTTKKESNNGQV